MNDTTELLISQLPAGEQEFAARLHHAFSNLTGSLAAGWAQIAADFGIGVSSVRRKYYEWRARGIAGLVNAARYPQFARERAVEIAPETFREFHDRCLANGRKCKPAYRTITKDFFDGAALPGVPPGRRTHLPAGWNYQTFMQHAPTKYELAAARQGRRSADMYRPLVFTTRKNLYPGQFVMIDEMWHNFDVAVLGRRQRCRLLQLHAHDVFSACQFARALKPRIRREDETRANINLSDVIFLMGYIFARFGHHPQGMCFILESGTATLPEEIRELITRLTRGKVTFKLGECRAERAFMGQYLGRAKGDFKLKAALESSHNLIQNEAANLNYFPGQTGSNSRLNTPDDWHGRGRHADKLLLAMAALPEDLRQRLRHPILISTDAIRAVDVVCETINWRGALPWWDSHEIEGFEEAGLLAQDYFFSGGGILRGADFLAKSRVEQAAIAAAAEMRVRKLSPAEVFYPAAKTFQRWRKHELAQLLWHARYEKPKTVGNDHLISFEDEDISPGKLRFLATHLSPGDQYFCVCNAMLPDRLFLYNLDGGFVGTLEHWSSVPREDTAAWERRAGEAAHAENLLLGPVREAGLTLTRKLEADAQHNAEVLTAHHAEAAANDDEIDAALRMD